MDRRSLDNIVWAKLNDNLYWPCRMKRGAYLKRNGLINILVIVFGSNKALWVRENAVMPFESYKYLFERVNLMTKSLRRSNNLSEKKHAVAMKAVEDYISCTQICPSSSPCLAALPVRSVAQENAKVMPNRLGRSTKSSATDRPAHTLSSPNGSSHLVRDGLKLRKCWVVVEDVAKTILRNQPTIILSNSSLLNTSKGCSSDSKSIHTSKLRSATNSALTKSRKSKRKNPLKRLKDKIPDKTQIHHLKRFHKIRDCCVVLEDIKGLGMHGLSDYQEQNCSRKLVIPKDCHFRVPLIKNKPVFVVPKTESNGDFRLCREKVDLPRALNALSAVKSSCNGGFSEYRLLSSTSGNDSLKLSEQLTVCRSSSKPCNDGEFIPITLGPEVVIHEKINGPHREQDQEQGGTSRIQSSYMPSDSSCEELKVCIVKTEIDALPLVEKPDERQECTVSNALSVACASRHQEMIEMVEDLGKDTVLVNMKFDSTTSISRPVSHQGEILEIDKSDDSLNDVVTKSCLTCRPKDQNVCKFSDLALSQINEAEGLLEIMKKRFEEDQPTSPFVN